MRISDWSSDVCSSDLARRRRQADLDAVEMVERAPPFAVDAAVTFVDHDEIEIAGRVLFVFVHQRLQGDDGDALFVLEPAAGARDRKSVVEGKRVSVGGDLGGGRSIKKKKKNKT